jgi:hypothetical protein
MDVSVKLYKGNFSNLTGGILASWFLFNPNGPTAYAVGFVEIADERFLFYRWILFTGGKTYLVATLDNEVSAASGNFGEVFFNLLLGVHNSFMASGIDQPIFSLLPNFILTNGNPAINIAIKSLISLSPSIRNMDWGRELYYLETYGTDLFGRAGEETREAYEKHFAEPQTPEAQEVLKMYWNQHEHIDSFRNWAPGRYQSRSFSEDSFLRWWSAVTDNSFVVKSILQFLRAWAGAVHFQKASGSGLIEKLEARGEFTPYSELVRFFDNFHLPLVPPELDEQFMLAQMRLRKSITR